MSKKHYGVVFLIVIASFTYHLNAQGPVEKQPLNEILRQIELRYRCNFSFADKDVDLVRIVPPDKNLGFQEALDHLAAGTGLVFNVLDNRFVTIAAPGRSIKEYCGILKDSRTHLPVSGATIESSRSSTISDTSGRFHLRDLLVGDSLSIRHLGYRPQSTIVARPEGTCPAIFLRENLFELDEIVVRDYLTEGISKSAQGAYRIDFKDFGILPGLVETDALQSVQTLPGIQSLDESVTRLNIRGGSHDQNLITWNGIKLYQTGHFFSLISAINPHVSRTVSLTKNGTASNLTDGTSGTIAIESSKGINEKVRAALGYNLISVDGKIELPLGRRASLLLAGRRSYSDVVTTDTYEQYFERAFQDTEVVQNVENVISSNDNFRFYDLNGVLNYAPSDRDHLQLSFIATNNDLTFLETAFVDNVEESRESATFQENIGMGLRYARQWNGTTSSWLNAYGLDYRLESRNADLLDGRQLIQVNEVKETALQVGVKKVFGGTMSASIGYDLIETGVFNSQEADNPLFRRFSKPVLRRHAVFSEWSSALWKNALLLRTGLRLNYTDPFGTFRLEPRFNAKLGLGRFWVLDLLAELKHQTSTQTVDFQTDFLGIENRRWVSADNSSIPLIRSAQVSTSLTYRRPEKGWLFSTEIFYKDVDGIVSPSQEFRNQFEFGTSTGGYFGQGIEMLLNKKTGNLSTWLGYSFMRLKYRFPELWPTDFTSNFNLDHSMTLGMAYDFRGLKGSLGLNWHSGRPTTRPVVGNGVVGGEINYSEPNGSSLSDYLRVDVSLRYRFRMGRDWNTDLGLSVWNVTNRANELGNYYRLTEGNSPGEVVQTSLEITPNLFVRVAF